MRLIHYHPNRKSWRNNNRAVSPAISTVIMTSALVVLVFVAMNYANSSLTVSIAGDEFSASKQFMQTVGMQIDNVAWTIGRTETVDFTSKYGQIAFVPNVINYTFEIYNGSSWQTIYNSTTGMIMYKIPVSSYTLGNNYFSRIVPSNNGSILQWNASAPVSQVFATEKLPMNDGSFARIISVPTVRALNSTLITGGSYYKFYLPTLIGGSNPYLSQSVTLTGSSLTRVMTSGTVYQVRINVTALATPSTPSGFNLEFFNFDHSSETINITQGSSGSLIEFYSGTVSVSIGLVA
jgi:ribosomal protein S19